MRISGRRRSRKSRENDSENDTRCASNVQKARRIAACIYRHNGHAVFVCADWMLKTALALIALMPSSSMPTNRYPTFPMCALSSLATGQTSCSVPPCMCLHEYRPAFMTQVSACKQWHQRTCPQSCRCRSQHFRCMHLHLYRSGETQTTTSRSRSPPPPPPHRTHSLCRDIMGDQFEIEIQDSRARILFSRTLLSSAHTDTHMPNDVACINQYCSAAVPQTHTRGGARTHSQCEESSSTDLRGKPCPWPAGLRRSRDPSIHIPDFDETFASRPEGKGILGSISLVPRILG